MHDVASTIHKIEGELNAAFFEREELIRAYSLGLLSGEHVVALGDPGVAKSIVASFYMGAITNSRFFKVQFSKNRSDEDVFGPIDILRFRETGDRVRRDKGYATAVDLAQFDEIGKMSPTTGHGMLGLLNEGEKYEVSDGRSVHTAPLHCAFCTSNEIPTRESDDAAALWDRLLIRLFVDDIRKKQNFAKLLTADIDPPTTRLDFDDLKKAAEIDVPAIPLSRDAITAIVELRTKLAGEHIEPSARRWRKSVRVLQAAAFLDGEDEVLESHLSVLKHTLWDDVENIDTVTQACESAANPFYDRVRDQLKLLGEVQKGIKDRTGDATQLAAYGQEATAKLATVRDNLDLLIMESQGRKIPGFANAADKHHELLVRAYVECMGTPRDVAEISAQKRLGMGGGSDVSTVVS